MLAKDSEVGHSMKLKNEMKSGHRDEVGLVHIYIYTLYGQHIRSLVILFFNYILLIMLLQLSWFFPLCSTPPSIPHSLRQSPHHCSWIWVMHICSLATPSPMLYLTSPWLFFNYLFVLLFFLQHVPFLSLFFIYIFKFLLLFNYSCLHFLPIPPPNPNQSYLPPPPLPSPLISPLTGT